MKASLAVTGVLLLVGCTSLDPGSDMEGAAHVAAERGVEDVALLAEGDLTRRVALLLSDGLSVDDAARIAVLNNRRARAEYEAIGIARADLVRAGLLTNPVFDFSIKFIEGGAGEVIEMGLSQRLTELLTMPTRRAVAETELEGARAAAVSAALRAAFDARRAVVDLQAARAREGMIAEGVEARRLAYEFVKSLHGAGNVTNPELTGRRIEYEEARLELADAELRTVEAREGVNRALGLWGSDLGWELAEELSAATEGEGATGGLEERAVRSSMELEQARLSLQRAARRAGGAGAAAVLDGVDAGAVAERNEEREWEVGPSVSVPIPIFDSGASGRAGAEAAMRRERELYALEAIEVRVTARRAGARLNAAQAEERHWRVVLVPLAERALEEMLLEYNAMQAGAPELLDARWRLARSRAMHAGALGRYWQAALDVEALAAGASVAPEVRGGETIRGALMGASNGGH